jgi:hypothetical protein
MYNQRNVHHHQADIDAGKVVNTALATAKIQKEMCNGYLWNHRDNDTLRTLH